MTELLPYVGLSPGCREQKSAFIFQLLHHIAVYIAGPFCGPNGMTTKVYFL